MRRDHYDEHGDDASWVDSQQQEEEELGISRFL
jgi:hypothetical protein